MVVRADGTYEVQDTTIKGLLKEASAIIEGNPILELESYGVGPLPRPAHQRNQRASPTFTLSAAAMSSISSE